MAHPRLWTAREDKTLAGHWNLLDVRDLVTLLDRSASAIYQRAREIGMPPRQRRLHALRTDDVRLPQPGLHD